AGFPGVGLGQVGVAVAGHHLVVEIHVEHGHLVGQRPLKAANARFVVHRALAVQLLVLEAVQGDAVSGGGEGLVHPAVKLGGIGEFVGGADARQPFGVGRGGGLVVGEHVAVLIVGFHPQARRDRQSFADHEAVLGIGCDALGAVDDVAVVDTGAVGGAVGSNAA